MDDTGDSKGDTYETALSHRDAIKDGLLVDLQPWAADLGYRIPVTCTTEVWDRLAPEKLGGDVSADDRRRIRLMLKRLRSQIRALPADADRLDFLVLLHIPGQRQRAFHFFACCGPGDKYEPTITILTLDEVKGVVDGN